MIVVIFQSSDLCISSYDWNMKRRAMNGILETEPK